MKVIILAFLLLYGFEATSQFGGGYLGRLSHLSVKLESSPFSDYRYSMKGDEVHRRARVGASNFKFEYGFTFGKNIALNLGYSFLQTAVMTKTYYYKLSNKVFFFDPKEKLIQQNISFALRISNSGFISPLDEYFTIGINSSFGNISSARNFEMWRSSKAPKSGGGINKRIYEIDSTLSFSFDNRYEIRSLSGFLGVGKNIPLTERMSFNFEFVINVISYFRINNRTFFGFEIPLGNSAPITPNTSNNNYLWMAQNFKKN